MDLLTLIETCSVAKDTALVLAMALSFSGGNPYTVQLPREADELDMEETADKSAAAPTRSRETAVAELRRMLAGGEAPVAGLLPATAAMARELERPVEDLLDPCAGLGIATSMVSAAEFDCEQERSKGQRKAQRQCVLQRYARAVGLEFFAEDVLGKIEEQDMPSADAPMVVETTAIREAAVYAEADSGRAWGADRIFITVAAPSSGGEPALPKLKPHAEQAKVMTPRRSPERLPVAPVPALPITSAHTLRVQRQ